MNIRFLRVEEEVDVRCVVLFSVSNCFDYSLLFLTIHQSRMCNNIMDAGTRHQCICA